MVHVRLDDDLQARLDRVIASTGRNISYYVRTSLHEYLDRNEELLYALSEIERKGSNVIRTAIVEQSKSNTGKQ